MVDEYLVAHQVIPKNATVTIWVVKAFLDGDVRQVSEVGVH
jgi:hypothetical protein